MTYAGYYWVVQPIHSAAKAVMYKVRDQIGGYPTGYPAKPGNCYIRSATASGAGQRIGTIAVGDATPEGKAAAEKLAAALMMIQEKTGTSLQISTGSPWMMSAHGGCLGYTTSMPYVVEQEVASQGAWQVKRDKASDKHQWDRRWMYVYRTLGMVAYNTSGEWYATGLAELMMAIAEKMPKIESGAERYRYWRTVAELKAWPLVELPTDPKTGNVKLGAPVKLWKVERSLIVDGAWVYEDKEVTLKEAIG